MAVNTWLPRQKSCVEHDFDIKNLLRIESHRCRIDGDLTIDVDLTSILETDIPRIDMEFRHRNPF